ncbi:MAG TPA: histidine kinase dimerization/phospho-acceptor domain-containing protein [Longimicrobiales bacterium]
MLTSALLLSTAALAAALVHSRRRAAALERRLESLRREARRADDNRRHILSSLNHELRGPLSAIIGYQELLADGLFGEVPQAAKEALARIAAASHELIELIDAVVDVARLDAREATLQLDTVDPTALLEASLGQDLAPHADAAATPMLHLHAGLPTLRSDPARLRRLLELVIDAARRATRPRRIDVHAHPRDDGGFTLLIPDAGLPPRAVDADGPASPRHGLRIDLAARLARALGASLSIEPAGAAATLRLEIPGQPRVDVVREAP